MLWAIEAVRTARKKCCCQRFKMEWFSTAVIIREGHSLAALQELKT